MSQYHEPQQDLTQEDENIVRALTSLKEEIEAINWYHQRIAAAEADELTGLLDHNKDEEMEHAAMLLEWLRRNMDGWDEALRTYLMTEKPILQLEEDEESEDRPAGNGDLGVGDPK